MRQLASVMSLVRAVAIWTFKTFCSTCCILGNGRFRRWTFKTFCSACCILGNGRFRRWTFETFGSTSSLMHFAQMASQLVYGYCFLALRARGCLVTCCIPGNSRFWRFFFLLLLFFQVWISFRWCSLKVWLLKITRQVK
jgi:hypothetical protein